MSLATALPTITATRGVDAEVVYATPEIVTDCLHGEQAAGVEQANYAPRRAVRV